MADRKRNSTTVSTRITGESSSGIHYARHGSLVAEEAAKVDESIDGYDNGRMRARTLLTAEEEKRLMRRIDWRLMTLCSIMFLLKNIDADNLGMTSNQYNLVTTLYYIPYIIAEAPSNLLIKRFKPSRWQSRIMVTWGIVTACHAALKNKEGLYTARFFLGLLECSQALSFKCATGTDLMRCLCDYCSSYADTLGNLSGIFSGLFAFAFSHLDGAHGLSRWRWLFLVEGIITIAFGIALPWILPDFPDTAKWLTEKEKAFIQARLPGNAPQASEMNFRWREILFTLIWALYTVGTSGVRFYQPTVIADLGFTDIASAQLLNLPISVFSIVVIGVTGAFADNGRLPRPLYPLSFLGIILVCYGVLYAYPNKGGVYAATLIGNRFPMMWPWRVQTTSKATGSAFSIGFVNSYGQIGGAISPHLFRSKYAPHYGVSFGIAMGFISACILTTLFTWWLTRKTEQDTRRLKVARVKAQKRGETVLNDVVDKDLKKSKGDAGSESSSASA
ncbi:putative pantothenate transporter [Byssothecium circinans]|uniref:Putative pantothenate transporter n=1 Tax=Byssothecium circinans TaxID=147558 RepID=A0A6A5UBX0_9PLEO|nr:putative pantothenate transporter [Byssothecium circinans]